MQLCAKGVSSSVTHAQDRQSRGQRSPQLPGFFQQPQRQLLGCARLQPSVCAVPKVRALQIKAPKKACGWVGGKHTYRQEGAPQPRRRSGRQAPRGPFPVRFRAGPCTSAPLVLSLKPSQPRGFPTSATPVPPNQRTLKPQHALEFRDPRPVLPGLGDFAQPASPKPRGPDLVGTPISESPAQVIPSPSLGASVL